VARVYSFSKSIYDYLVYWPTGFHNFFRIVFGNRNMRKHNYYRRDRFAGISLLVPETCGAASNSSGLFRGRAAVFPPPPPPPPQGRVRKRVAIVRPARDGKTGVLLYTYICAYLRVIYTSCATRITYFTVITRRIVAHTERISGHVRRRVTNNGCVNRSIGTLRGENGQRPIYTAFTVIDRGRFRYRPHGECTRRIEQVPIRSRATTRARLTA